MLNDTIFNIILLIGTLKIRVIKLKLFMIQNYQF